MCGIFGMIQKSDKSVITSREWDNFKMLGILNIERGDQASGYANNMKIHKKNVSFNKLIERVKQPMSGSIIGHTRYATQGLNTPENAHPFKFGDTIGVHNGIIDNADKYEVDSMKLFDTIEKNQNNIKAFRQISGSIATVYRFNGEYYFLRNDNPLYYVIVDDVLYFSSLELSLLVIGGNVQSLPTNTLYKWNGMKLIKVGKVNFKKRKIKTNWYSYGSGNYFNTYKSTHDSSVYAEDEICQYCNNDYASIYMGDYDVNVCKDCYYELQKDLIIEE